MYVVVDYLTFLILLNDFVRGESPCPVLFYGVGDSIYEFMHSSQAQSKPSYILSLLLFYHEALQDSDVGRLVGSYLL